MLSLRCKAWPLPRQLLAAGWGTDCLPQPRALRHACPCAVLQVVSAWTGVPVERMSEDDRERLLTLADALKASAGVQQRMGWPAVGVQGACDAAGVTWAACGGAGAGGAL